MVRPSDLFSKVPDGEFVDQIGEVKVGDRIEVGNGTQTVEVKFLQRCKDGSLIAYYDYDGGAEGCSYLHPNGRLRK